jgi:hypothetical protein
VLLNKLAQLTKDKAMAGKIIANDSGIDSSKWQPLQVDFESDSNMLLKTAEEKEHAEMVENAKTKELVPVD